MLWLHNTSLFIALGLWTGLGAAILAGPPTGRWSRLAAAVAAGLLALAVWSPFLPVFLEQGRSVQAGAFWVEARASDLWSAWLLVAGGPLLLPPVLLAALLGLLALRRRHGPAALHLALVLMVPLGAMLAIHFTFRPIFIDRLFIWMTPAVTALAAIGLLHGMLAGRVRLVVTLLIFGFSLATGVDRPASEDWRGLVATIASSAQPGDRVIALPAEIDPAIGYYAGRQPDFPQVLYVPGPFPHREPGRVYVGNLGAPRIEPEDAARLKPALAKPGRIWLVSRREDRYDPQALIRGAIAESRRSIGRSTGSAITVELFE
jgi:hypothetical protein